MSSKKTLIVAGIGMLAGALALALFLHQSEPSVQPINNTFSVNGRLADAMSAYMQSTFNALNLFKQENGYLPSEDNQSTAAALLGKNKLKKNYIRNWPLDNVGHLLDVTNEPLVFHFINGNEITIYSRGTQQQLHGFLDTGKVTIDGPAQ